MHVHTSTLLFTALTSKLWNTSFLAATGSVATMSDATSTPFDMKPLAKASAICPAPMKPTRLLSFSRAILAVSATR